MISFYPGPSQVYAAVPHLVQQAYEAGMLGINHRSPEFGQLYRRAKQALFSTQNIPEDYALLFFSSATECWEVLAQSLPVGTTTHLVAGSFGQKWQQLAAALGETQTLDHDPLSASLSPLQLGSAKLALVHNETSNGTALPDQFLSGLRQRNAESLIAVDATSSLGGYALDWRQADYWFASVQKCLGLPAGMAIMLVSPRGQVAAAHELEAHRYNSLAAALDNATRCETTHTPNVLNVYLLAALQEAAEPIGHTQQRLLERRTRLYEALAAKGLTVLGARSQQSLTVVGVQAKQDRIADMHQRARSQHLLLGQGYGKWKNDSLRIANFPALSDGQWNQLLEFISSL